MAWKSKCQKYLIAAIQHSFLAAFLVEPIKYNLKVEIIYSINKQY